MTRRHPRSHSAIARALESAWAKGWATKPRLDARHIAGKGAPGPWRDRLEILCRSLNAEAGLNPIGLTSAYGQLRKLVKARLRLEALLRRNPAIGSRPLAPPVIIVGQMRSGTTRIHRLLALDSRFAANRLYEQFDPVPYRGPVDPRPWMARATQAGLAMLNNAISTIHPTSSNAVEEEFGFHAYSIWGAQFEGQWLIPSFARHVEEGDASDVYAEFATLLRVAAANRRLDPQRPWLLKAPQFTQELDALLGQFPEARLIVLDRDPASLVGSSASLVWNHVQLQSDSVTREAVGREWLRKTSLRKQRMVAALARHHRVPKVMLDYTEVSNDWRSAIDAIYAMLGLSLDSATLARMELFVTRSTSHKGHRYRIADFGLAEADISRAFA